MTKEDAFRLSCRVSMRPGQIAKFSHQIDNVVFDGEIKAMPEADWTNYWPLAYEIDATASVIGSGIKKKNLGKRYTSVEDAVVHIFNGLDYGGIEQGAYKCLEDILF